MAEEFESLSQAMLRDVWKTMAEVKGLLGSLTGESKMTLELVKDLKTNVERVDSDVQDSKVKMQSVVDRVSALEGTTQFQDARLTVVETEQKSPDPDRHLTTPEVHYVRSKMDDHQWLKRNVISIAGTVIMIAISVVTFISTHASLFHHLP